jgi:glycosyltransferase involved in cell wall biosynthesis
VFCEAVAAGLPVVAPDGTWMGDQITAGRCAGIAYPGEGAEVEADAVAKSLAELGSLRAAAASLAAPWRRAESLGAVLDAIDDVIANRAEAPARGLPG